MKNVFLFLLGASFLFQSCSSEDDSSPQVDPPAISEAVKLADNATLGKILTDAEGMSLYFFSKDTKDTSECTDGCLNIWPIFYKEDLSSLGAGLEAADFATITRADGEKQTTYKGWPLYYYASDNAAGDTNGDDVGNVWYIAKPDYSVMYAKTQLVGHDGKNYLGDYTEGDGETSYIVNIAGRTMYAFINDAKDTNNYTAADFSNDDVWPIVKVSIDQIPSILANSDFGTIDVHGETQLTYRGWPLYYFGQDTERGDNKGISFPAPGVWPIVNTDTPMAEEPVVAAATVNLADDATLGKILTDADGMSLYFFSKDTKETSECTGGCISSWPVFYKEDITLSEGLEAADFATITRADGEKQTTYKGWPLYYYGADVNAGDTNGDDVGGVWYIAKPDYSVMYAKTQLVGHDGKNYLGDYTEGDGETSYIVNIAGRTMYTFINDDKDTNNYTNADFSNDGVWPIVKVSIDQIPSILANSDFGTIDVHGETQLTYKGWPLYYFGQDTERGDNKGISFPSPGVWPIANIDIAAAGASSAATTTSTSTY